MYSFSTKLLCTCSKFLIFQHRYLRLIARCGFYLYFMFSKNRADAAYIQVRSIVHKIQYLLIYMYNLYKSSLQNRFQIYGVPSIYG